MAKCNSSDSNEIISSPNKKSSISNSKTPMAKHSSSNKLKIAHRTRSKCPIERNISDLEAELPDDLLLGSNETTADVLKMISNTNLNISNTNDSLLTSASTPLSAIDQNDHIYHEFLTDLIQTTKQNESPSKLIDNDDATEDPDFTLCLDNYNDNFYDDFDYSVPKKEVIELISDQFELFDSIPLVSETKSKRAITSQFKTNSTDNNTNNLISSDSLSSQPLLQTTELLQQEQSSLTDLITVQVVETLSVEQTITTTSNNLDQISSGDFFPQFTELQRKQLDEQLRNHVQMLTQMCVVTYNSTEYKSLFTEAKALLNVLDNLNKGSLISNETTDKPNNSDQTRTNSRALLSPSFEIINLKDAFLVIEQLEGLEIPEWDLNNGIPPKILETIVNSRVFYNTSLLPVNKYKYSSQFHRSAFTDCEKILLILGFNQFKHLPKDECCKCIKEAVLGHRSCHDIKKQLSGISNSEERQASLKDLIKRQKASNQSNTGNFDFKKETHYKSPLEQADRIQLPSMYTLTVERLKMANILKETKNYINQNKQKQSAEKECKSKRTRTVKKKSDNKPTEKPIERVVEKPANEQLSHNNSVTVIDSDDDCTIISNNDHLNDLNQTLGYDENIISVSTPSSTSKRARLDISPERSTTPIKIVINNSNNQTNTNTSKTSIPKKAIDPTPKQTISSTTSAIQSVTSNSLLNLLSNNQPTVIIDSSGRVMTMPSLVSPFQTVSNLQYLSMIPQPQQFMPNSNLVLPNSFNGTILYNPTIHIHTNGKSYLDMSKYKKLAPKK